jgi:hypothetical protein
MPQSSSSAGTVFASFAGDPGESTKRIVRPASVSRLKGGALLEHVWNAVIDAYVETAFPLLREEMSRSGGNLLTLAGDEVRGKRGLRRSDYAKMSL